MSSHSIITKTKIDSDREFKKKSNKKKPPQRWGDFRKGNRSGEEEIKTLHFNIYGIE